MQFSLLRLLRCALWNSWPCLSKGSGIQLCHHTGVCSVWLIMPFPDQLSTLQLLFQGIFCPLMNTIGIAPQMCIQSDTDTHQTQVLHILASTPLLCYIPNTKKFNERRIKSSLSVFLFTEEHEKQSFPSETFWKFSVNLDNL